MIHTREQLIDAIENILCKWFDDKEELFHQCSDEIADLIASLNDPNEEWKSVP
jgi:hypothetical protein